jgi:hypothetical protein
MPQLAASSNQPFAEDRRTPKWRLEPTHKAPCDGMLPDTGAKEPGPAEENEDKLTALDVEGKRVVTIVAAAGLDRLPA